MILRAIQAAPAEGLSASDPAWMAPFLDSLAREDLAPATVARLTKARARPHVLDDATIDRVQRVHGEQLEFVDIYAEQVRRWRAEGPSATQRRELDRLEQQNRRLRQVTTEVLALAAELRKGTIDRIMAMSDLELGMQALLGTLPPRP